MLGVDIDTYFYGFTIKKQLKPYIYIVHHMAYTAEAETNEIPAPDHECMHTYTHRFSLHIYHKPTMLALSLITVTSTIETLIIEPQ